MSVLDFPHSFSLLANSPPDPPRLASRYNSSKGGPNRPGFTYKPSDWLPATEEDAIKTGGAGAFAYSVSKKLAEKAAWDFVEKERPSWDIVTFNPPMM